jgi:hypothetical protein
LAANPDPIPGQVPEFQTEAPVRHLLSIGTKLTLAISLVIALGFGAIVYFYTQQQERNFLLQNERALNQVLDSVNQGLQTVMITASADVAQLYADKLKGVKDIEEIRILRPDGIEAFRDNATINQVNEYRDTIEFTPRPGEEVFRDPSLPPTRTCDAPSAASRWSITTTCSTPTPT